MKKMVLLNSRSNFILISIFSILLICISCDNSEDVKEVIVDKELVVEEDTLFYGNYSGGWSSNAANGSVYNNIAASIIINEGTGAEWTGEFFFTRNYTACCGGTDNNGTISFTMEDSVITDFEYIDTIPGCRGTFQGEGILTSEGDLFIEFTGEDCEGAHSNGILKVSK